MKSKKNFYVYKQSKSTSVVLSDISPTLFNHIKINAEALNTLSQAQAGNRFIAVVDIRDGRFFVAPSDQSFNFSAGNFKLNGQALTSPILARNELGLTGHDQLVAKVATGDNIKAGLGKNLNAPSSLVQKAGGKFSYENNFVALNLTFKQGKFEYSGRNIYLNARHLFYPTDDRLNDIKKDKIRLTEQELKEQTSRVAYDKPNTNPVAARLPASLLNQLNNTIQERLTIYQTGISGTHKKEAENHIAANQQGKEGQERKKATENTTTDNADNNKQTGGLFGLKPETKLPLGWIGERPAGAPTLEDITVTYTDKFAEGESHISTLKTQDGHHLVAKIERSVAEGHLADELKAYQQIYEKAGYHKNLGKAYGMAVVPYGKRKEEALIIEEVQGKRGSEVLRSLSQLWKNGKISSAEYWGAIQFIGRRLLDVTAHLSKAGIVHNDIKPDNFVVDKFSGEPVVIDLGLHSGQNEKPRGVTEYFKPPELSLSSNNASEKSDVFTVGATLLYGVEDLETAPDKKAKDGLVITNLDDQAYSRDETGVAKHKPGVAGVETAYTQFLEAVLNGSPGLRPSSEQAQLLEFLNDSLVNDDTAKAVLKKSIDVNYSIQKTVKAITDKKIKEISSKLIEHRQFIATKQLVVEAVLDDLKVASDYLYQAEYEGAINREQLQKLHKSIHNLYPLVSRYINDKNGENRPIEAKLVRIATRQFEAFEPEVDRFLNHKLTIADIPKLETLHLRINTLIDVLTPQQTDKLPNGKIYVKLHDLTTLQNKVTKQIDQLTQQQQVASQATSRLLDQLKTWFDQANTALKGFDEIKPVVKHGSGADIEAYRQKIADQAKSALANVDTLQEHFQAFLPEAKKLLSELGRRQLPNEQLTQTREKIRQAVTVAERLIRLEKEWINPEAKIAITTANELYQKQNQLTDLFNQRLTSIEGDISLRPAVTAVFDNTDLTTINRSLVIVAAHADYLASQAASDIPQDGWLTKFNSLAELANEQAFGLLSEADQASIKSYLNQLNQLDSALQTGTGLGQAEVLTVEGLIETLQVNTSTDVQSYLLTVGDQSLTVVARQANGQWQFTVNHASLGEITGISQPSQLQQVLNNYLNTVNDVAGTQHTQLLVAKVNHQALATPELNGQFAVLAQPVNTTVDQLIALDETAGKIQIGELTVNRDTLYDLGATIDGKAIDSQTDFNDPELLKKLQFSQGKVQDFLHTTASDVAGQEVVQLIKTIDQARTEAGLSGRAIVENGSPDHWLRTQLETISSNKLAFDQAKQLLQFGKTYQLSVELAPAANRKQNTSLADILAVASTQHQGGDIQALLANQNRSRFVNELITKNRHNSVEAEAVQQYGEAQAELAKHFNDNVDFQRSLGRLTIRRLTEQLTGGGNKTLALQSGQHHYLVAKQNNQLSFYDPKTGWISGFADTQALQGFLTDYFSDLNRLQLGTSAAAFQVNEITPQFFTEKGVKAATAKIQQVIPVELDLLSKLDLSQGPLTVGEQKISRVQLWQLGAQIQGQPVAGDNLRGDWTADISFNSKTLKQHLSSISTSEFADSAAILKTLANQKRFKVENLVEGSPSRQLTQVLQSIDSDASLTGQHISQLQSKIASPRINAGTIKHVAAQTPGIGLQVWGIYSGLKSAVDAFKKGDTQEGLIQTGAVAANIASIPAEIALSRSLPKLGKRLTVRLASSSSRFAAASSNLGKLLGRSAGLGAALITLPFDIYSAVKAFTDAGAEGLTDKQRQDLYVQGGFAVAGAAVSLGLGVAALVTGSAALGPIGLGLSVALIVGTQIYSAVRQVEEVWNHVPELDDWRHRLRQGWLAFWGQDMDEWVLDAYKENKTRDDYLKQTRERSAQLLQSALGQSVDTIVYGSFNVELRNEQVWQGDGSYKWEKFPHVIGGDDTIDARNGTHGLANAITHEADPNKAVLFNIGGGRDNVYGVTDKRNEFIFGQGYKQLIGGNLNDNFSFSADLATLTRFAANLNPDGSLKNSDEFIYFRLDGQGGENTLTINTATFNKWAKEGSPAQHYYGYVIDLEQGKVWLKKSGEVGEAAKGPEIGALANIQHTTGSGVGAQEGNDGFSDIIYGSAQSNNIVANFGDQVYGRGGNDVITLTDHAQADGGAGQDIYLVQRGIRQGIIEENGEEVSVVRLEFALEEITDWQLLGNDLVIHFVGLNKQLTIKAVYQEEGGQLVLQNDKLSFQTRDGFMLVPQLDKTRTLQAAEQPESITLSTRYLKAGDKTYFDEETGITIDLADNRIDGNNQGGEHQGNEFETLDKSQLIVLQGDAGHQNAPAGSGYFIERGAGETVIRPQAQDNNQPATNKVFLNYDASEITAIETRYQAEQYDYHYSGGVVRNAGYHRKNYALVVTLQDGRQVVLEDIIDKTTHAGDALPYGGNVLRDFLLITRDGIAYSLQDKSGQTKVLATHSHYHDRNNNGVFTVNTLNTLNKQDYKLTDWQWGRGKQLANRYQLSAEGTAFDDTLLGNADANVIRGYGGNDHLQGNDGHDTYVIGALSGTVTINNVATDQQLDSAIIGAAFKDISSRREGDNLILSAQLPRPNEQGGTTDITRQVILENYFVGDDYRHISIVSNEGHQQEFVVDEQGQISRLVVLAENSEEGSTEEAVIDGIKGNIVQGSQTGDQVRINADQSSTVIYADGGDDVITFNSSGNDVASGGEGNDRYQVTQASRGIKVIDNQAEAGEDVLVLEQIDSLDNLQLARNGLDLHLLTKDNDGKIATANTTEVIIKNYYLAESYRHISLMLAQQDVSETELYGLSQLAPARTSLVIDQGTSEVTNNAATEVNTANVVELDGEAITGNEFNGTDQDDHVKLKKVGQLQQIDLGAGENTLDLSSLKIDKTDGYGVFADLSDPRLYANAEKLITLKNIQHVIGTDIDDSLIGNSLANKLQGGLGNDRIYGVSGSNTIIGGKGDDTLIIGSGRDTIVFNKGDGKDTVETGYLGGNTTGDVLNLKDISLYDVHFSIPTLEFDNTLHISFKGQAGDHIAIENWDENQGFEVITDDGSVIDKQGIDQLIQSLASFDATAWASSSAPVDAQTKAAIASTWTITS